MPVRAKAQSGSRDREIGAGDDAKRAVEGTVRTLRNTASDRHISVMLHEISEVFISRKAVARRRTIDHGVHRIRQRPPSVRNRDGSRES